MQGMSLQCSERQKQLWDEKRFFCSQIMSNVDDKKRQFVEIILSRNLKMEEQDTNEKLVLHIQSP